VLALYREGVAAFRAGDRATSLARNTEALKLARNLRDPELEALALVGLSRIALRDGDYGRVRKLAGDALDLVRERRGEAQLMPLHMLAAGTRMDGEYEAALELYNESLELSRSLHDDRMAAGELHNIGHVYLHLDRLADAERAFAERERVMAGPPRPYDAAMTALNEATLAHLRGDDSAALRLLDEAAEGLRVAGIELDPDDAFEVAWLRARVGSRTDPS
jgi:tetratricopeptide (TPR) repeat protein